MKITATKTLQLYYITPLISLHANELGDNSPRGCREGHGACQKGWGPHAASVAHKIEQNTCKVRQRQTKSEWASERDRRAERKWAGAAAGGEAARIPWRRCWRHCNSAGCLLVSISVCVFMYVSVCVLERAAKGIGKNLGRARFSWQDTALGVYYLILSTSCVEISSHKSMKRLAQVYN